MGVNTVADIYCALLTCGSEDFLHIICLVIDSLGTLIYI